ncbi:MAG TPA: hypothetical protein VJG83_00025 [archaeon]|nr:hypothetical protein [archaeon]
MKIASIFLLILFLSPIVLAACLLEAPPKKIDPLRKKIVTTLNYGVICFGPEKNDCAARFGTKPLLRLNLPLDCRLTVQYIALIDVFIFIGILHYIFYKSPVPLVIMLIALFYLFLF